MILEVKRAFTNFLKMNSDSTSTGHMKNGIQTGSQGNSSLTDQDCPNPLLRNSVHHGDGCDKTKEYCHRFGFRGSTVSDSLDLASHRNQTSSHPKFRQESIELGLICPEKVYSTKQSSLNGHLFCPVPLDGDTFCDHCNQPIWELGWRPVCLKCAKCHMTCHWLCKDEVTVLCDEDAKCIHQTAEESPFLAEVISNEEIENVSNQLCQLSTYLENDEKSTFEDTLTKPSEVDSGLGIQLTTESDIRLSDTVSPEEYCTVYNFIDKVVDHIPTEVTAEINSPSSSQQHFKSINRDSNQSYKLV
ncbi:unnamed protein product [Heterobilharzia americana]|nr:unnamed protein product [Heterobilharzia americana]